MDVGKIIILLAVLFALLAGIVSIPGAAAIIAIAGLIAGWFIDEQRVSRFLIAALALALVHGAVTPVPAIGPYMTDMLESLSALLNAAACTVVAVELARRVKP
jgi:hypothetical protein